MVFILNAEKSVPVKIYLWFPPDVWLLCSEKQLNGKLLKLSENEVKKNF